MWCEGGEAEVGFAWPECVGMWREYLDAGGDEHEARYPGAANRYADELERLLSAA